MMVCVNHRFGDKPSCAGSGSRLLADWLEREIAARGLALTLIRSPCQNACLHGPAIRVVPGGGLFLNVTAAQLPEILDKVGVAAPQTDLPMPV